MIAVSRVGLRSTRSVSALDLSDPSDLKSLAHDCGCFLWSLSSLNFRVNSCSLLYLTRQMSMFLFCLCLFQEVDFYSSGSWLLTFKEVWFDQTKRLVNVKVKCLNRNLFGWGTFCFFNFMRKQTLNFCFFLSLSLSLSSCFVLKTGLKMKNLKTPHVVKLFQIIRFETISHLRVSLSVSNEVALHLKQKFFKGVGAILHAPNCNW